MGDTMKLIMKDQALDAITNGEFGNDIIGTSEKVAVILTQSWCPQWYAMKLFAADFSGAEIYFLEYDRTNFFDEFRRFKEQVLGNDQIPYVRYYSDGVLIAESNYVSAETFQQNIGK